ncbi:MAG: DUF4276 family protein [Thermoguttaceae bacterium]|nr:DUF4276 family protein [Thermoguttaceae bacterium]
MKNVYVYCEGQTEESFVNMILRPYFWRTDIDVIPIICTTKRTNIAKYKGGATNYQKVKKELTILCKSHPNEYITTMFDYYAMPRNTPGIGNHDADILKRVESIEDEINTDIGMRNCFFHFMLHEFEGILFSNPTSFRLIADERAVEKIQKIRNSFPTPEHINDSPVTAPSKRIKQIIPNYAKVRNGVIISEDIGIDVILRECPHFRNWIKHISDLARCQ